MSGLETSVCNDGAVEPPDGYIRGGLGVPTNSRHVLSVTAYVVLAALAVFAIALTVAGMHQNARRHQLQQHGIDVRVTVTSCIGTATGTGITVNSFTCRGNFELNGRQHNDVIAGNDQLRQRGEVLQGVTDPASPGVLSTATALASTSASWRPYLTPAILTGLLLLTAVAYTWRSRHTKRPGVA